jgi:hypothetical protein
MPIRSGWDIADPFIHVIWAYPLQILSAWYDLGLVWKLPKSPMVTCCTWGCTSCAALAMKYSVCNRRIFYSACHMSGEPYAQHVTIDILKDFQTSPRSCHTDMIWARYTQFMCIIVWCILWLDHIHMAWSLACLKSLQNIYSWMPHKRCNHMHGISQKINDPLPTN